MVVGWINIFSMSPATGHISDWTSLTSHQNVRLAHLTHVVRCLQAVDDHYSFDRFQKNGRIGRELALCYL